MKIGGLKKLSLSDFPNTPSCVVYLSGCNLRCPFCYVREFVLPEESQKHSIISEKDFFKFLKEKRDWLQGVCVSGGEPTIYPELVGFFRKIKKSGYKTKLDTNGSNPDLVASLIARGLIDYLAVDIKAPREKYSQTVGFGEAAVNYLLSKIDKTIQLAKSSSVDYEFRTTAVPGLIEKRDILEIAKWLKPARKYVINRFVSDGNLLDESLKTRRPLSDKDLFKIKQAISPFFDIVKVA